MSLRVEGSMLTMEPGPIDVHTHPRVFDPLVEAMRPGDPREGKAGLAEFTAVALRCGLTAMIAMPNESLRRPDRGVPGLTRLEDFPISTVDKLAAMQSRQLESAFIPTGNNFGVDPSQCLRPDSKNGKVDSSYLYRQFKDVKDDVLGLKLYGAKTNVKQALALEHIPEITWIWHHVNPEKPVTMHLEDDGVEHVLKAINAIEGGKKIPIHIAHVSSREELEAVMWAKKIGMNVTCEVTPHHLFLDRSIRRNIGGFAHVKPLLKLQDDIDFIWDHIDQVDMFASDCAPHQRADKAAANPVPGFANHSVMIPLLLGAVAEVGAKAKGKLTMRQFYEKLCINPRRRFNLPLDDNSMTRIHLRNTTVAEAENAARPRYNYNPFVDLEGKRKLRLIGRVVEVAAGRSYFNAEDREEHLVAGHAHVLSPRALHSATQGGGR